MRASPQLSNIRACRKYWLIAVSSFFRTSLRCFSTVLSPCIGSAPGRNQSADLEQAALKRQLERKSEAGGEGTYAATARPADSTCASMTSRAESSQRPQQLATGR